MSVSNTADVPLLTGASINMDMITHKPKDSSLRHTKIICTIGPACWEPQQLETLIDTGMDVARFNFSHGDHKGHGATLERVRAAAQKKSKNIGTSRMIVSAFWFGFFKHYYDQSMHSRGMDQ